jgi:hypothetical protein
MSQRLVAKTESAKVTAQLAAAEGWRQVGAHSACVFCFSTAFVFCFTLVQEWLQVHHALRSVVRKIEGDYGNEDNLNTRATAIMSNLQERALAEANAKAEVRRMQERLTLCEVERNVMEKRLMEFDTQFVQMRARAAVAENAVAFQLQPSPRHQVLMSNAADMVRSSGARHGAVNERGQLALPSSVAQVRRCMGWETADGVVMRYFAVERRFRWRGRSRISERHEVRPSRCRQRPLCARTHGLLTSSPPHLHLAAGNQVPSRIPKARVGGVRFQ